MCPVSVRVQPRGLLGFLDSNDKVPVNEADLLLPRNNLEAATNELRQSALKEKLESFRYVRGIRALLLALFLCY